MYTQQNFWMTTGFYCFLHNFCQNNYVSCSASKAKAANFSPEAAMWSCFVYCLCIIYDTTQNTANAIFFELFLTTKRAFNVASSEKQET